MQAGGESTRDLDGNKMDKILCLMPDEKAKVNHALGAWQQGGGYPKSNSYISMLTGSPKATF